MNHDFIMGKVQAAQMILDQATITMPHQMKLRANEAHYAMNILMNLLATDRDKPRKTRKRPA